MKFFNIFAGAALAAGLATSASAAPGIAAVSVVLGPEMQAKAEKLGPAELTWLRDQLLRQVNRQILRNGGFVENGSTLEITLVDATPNRPTMREMTRSPGLSYQSYGIGGAEIRATLTSPEGVATPITYRWYETDIRQTAYLNTWSDAGYAFTGFARRVVAAGTYASR